jgi:ribonuclease D
MKLKIFSLAIDEEGGLDDQDMQAELEGCEILQVWERFLELERVWLIMVGYRYANVRKPQNREERKQENRRNRERLVDKLDPLEKEVFEALREWRKGFAIQRQTGPHFILTNAQLVELIKRKPQTLPDLAEVKGIGQGKINDFGSVLLEAIKQAWSLGEQSLTSQDEGTGTNKT